MVCFINGAADRTKYRRFKLRKQQNNDPESMLEVITRRLRHLDDWGRPDLIILDGSVGQLSAVRKACVEAGVPVIGRDKSGDHSKNARVRIVVLEGEDDYRMVELAPDSHIAKLIARIDDESHRFAIQYHTLLKRKDALK
jgi:excinuclease ABC subunit C